MAPHLGRIEINHPPSSPCDVPRLFCGLGGGLFCGLGGGECAAAPIAGRKERSTPDLRERNHTFMDVFSGARCRAVIHPGPEGNQLCLFVFFLSTITPSRPKTSRFWL